MFADRERLYMVTETSGGFLHGDHDRNVDRAIERIDHLADDVSNYLGSQEKIGPFGVFTLRMCEEEGVAFSGVSDEPGSATSNDALSAQSPEAITIQQDAIDEDDALDTIESVFPWIGSMGESTMPCSETTNADLWPMDSPMAQQHHGDAITSHQGSDLNPISGSMEIWEQDKVFAQVYSNQPLPEPFGEHDNVEDLDLIFASTQSQPYCLSHEQSDRIPRSVSNMKNISKIPCESRYLLEHYFTQVVDYMCHFPNPQSPWRTIYFPCAMSTMADLLVFGETNHARMALFYALLSVSANHLNSKIAPTARVPGNVTEYLDSACLDTGSYWLTRGSLFQRMAAGQIHACLQTQIWGLTNREARDELLMSLLSMVTISVTSGELKSADTYLSHAKRMIEIGFRDPQHTAVYRSSKMGTLHQIYSYLDIIYSSTQVKKMIQEQPISLLDSESPDILGPAAPPPSLDWPQGLDNAQFLARTYGVPRSLLALIAKVSNTAREIETQTALGAGGAYPTDTQHLEDQICNWRASPNDNELHDATQPTYNPQIKTHLVSAMHDALIVMFFRRIRPINRVILQHYVESAADHLNTQEEAKVQAGINAPALLWPWFMVATEAIGAEVRQKLALWATVARRYGGRNLGVAEQVVNEVWRRQDQELPNQSWVDVVREWDVTLVLT
ncbi:fungal-specific transcription factor domain-containing protein [Aspergillus heterothallicus]